MKQYIYRAGAESTAAAARPSLRVPVSCSYSMVAPKIPQLRIVAAHLTHLAEKMQQRSIWHSETRLHT